MKIIHFDETETIQRDDGRTIKELCRQELGMPVDSIKFIFVIHPPNFTEKQHYHKESFEIFFFMDEADYLINGKEFKIRKNDLVIFEPGDVHGGIPTPNEVRLFIMHTPAVKGDKHFPEG